MNIKGNTCIKNELVIYLSLYTCIASFLYQYFITSESVVACVFLGLAKGAILGCLSVVPLEMLGPKRFSTGLGIICFVAGVCTSILGPING